MNFYDGLPSDSSAVVALLQREGARLSLSPHNFRIVADGADIVIQHKDGGFALAIPASSVTVLLPKQNIAPPLCESAYKFAVGTEVSTTLGRVKVAGTS